MTTQQETVARLDQRAFWRWLLRAARPFIGWVLAGLGALALFLGWYGVSGQSLTAKQLPYLVSGGLTGIGLVVIAAVFLATDDVRRQLGRLDEIERKVDDLYALLVAAPATEPAATTTTDGYVALPTGTSYHRPTCALVAGKANAVAVDDTAISSRGLKPCRVCDPPPIKPRPSNKRG
jgi:hypothetical protein